MTPTLNQSDNQSQREEGDLYAALGAAVVRWNSIESLMRLLLYKAAGGTGDRLEVLIANLGNVALPELLKAIADHFDDVLREHLKHAAELFESGRLYRNHYVHGPTMVICHEKTAVGFTQSTCRKGGHVKASSGPL